jgi:hypothetical protein
MRIRIKTTAFLFAGLLSVWAMAQQPGMTRDRVYIQASIAKNGFYEKSEPNGEYYSERQHITFAGCSMTVHMHAVSAEEPPYKRESYDADFVFDLNMIDPKIVVSPEDLNHNTLPGGREWVILRTFDLDDRIKIMHDGTLVSVTSGFPLQGESNHEANQKLADALSRVITACHQK